MSPISTLVRALMLAPCISFGFAPSLDAQCLEERIPWALQADAGFGTSVAVAQDVIVVGAPTHTQPGLGVAGGVIVSRRVGPSWVSTSLPLPGLLRTGDLFGFAVAISTAADVIVVGAPGNDTIVTDGGMIVIYEYNAVMSSWQIVAEWPGVFPTGLYGFDVDASEGVIAVGEPGGFGGVGAVNVYRRTGPGTWVNDALFTGTNFLDAFGWSVAISGDRMVVGIPFDDTGAADAGKAAFYKYSGTTWSLQSTHSESQAYAHFGAAVEVDGQLAAVGAPDYDFSNPNAGAAVFFAWFTSPTFVSGWSTGGSNQHFASSIAMSGGVAVVSTPWSPGAFGVPLGAEAGIVSIYRWNGTGFSNGQNEFFTATDVVAGDHFGTALALDGDRVVVGAPFVDDTVTNSGAAYVYDLAASGTVANLGFGLAGTGGFVPTLSAHGPLCGHTTVSVELQAVPSAYAVMVIGASGLYAPFMGGTMVPNPDVISGLGWTDTNGRIAFTTFWPPGVPAVNVYIQSWILDAGAPQGYAATNGLLFASVGG